MTINDEGNDEFKKKLKDDLTWLSLACPKIPNPEMIEDTIQALSIFKSINPYLNRLTKADLIKLAYMGYIATCSRKVDVKRFQEISPYAYTHLAQFWTDPDNENEYIAFIKRISG